MFPGLADWIKMLLAFAVSLLVAYVMTPPVKRFAEKVGAIDVPRDNRRVHDHPIPRMGGLAIFLGFIVSTLLFADITQEVRGILIGSIIIVITGVIDDIVSLRAWTKFLIQILAAVIAVLHGVVINVVSNPNVFSSQEAIVLGWLAIPLTVLWIVGITNSVNLIDGLDGLAVGVSTISCVTILVVALLVSEPNVALIVAALAGACIGFMPYNLNPARIFMGDTGSLALGGGIGAVAVATKHEIVLGIIGGLFVMETLSVMIQVVSFKLTGKRVFRMAPIHHHFEKLGWSESTVVIRFWIIAVMLALLGLATMKLR